METHKAEPKRLGTSQSARPASRAGLVDGSPLRPRTNTPGAGSLFILDGCSRPASRAEQRSPGSRPESRPASCEAGLEAGTIGKAAHRLGLVDGHSARLENGSGATGTKVPRTPQKNGAAHRDVRAAPMHHHLRTDMEDDFSDSEKLEIANLDTSLAEEMQAVPQEGTVLRYVTPVAVSRLLSCSSSAFTLPARASPGASTTGSPTWKGSTPASACTRLQLSIRTNR
jgi:hypothetical protein